MANQFDPISKVYHVEVPGLDESIEGVDKLAKNFDNLSKAAKTAKGNVDKSLLQGLLAQQKLALQQEQARQKILQAQAKTEQQIYKTQQDVNKTKQTEEQIQRAQVQTANEVLKSKGLEADALRKQAAIETEIAKQKVLQQRYDITAAAAAAKQQAAADKAAQQAAAAARKNSLGGVAGIFAQKTGSVLANYAATYFSVQQGIQLVKDVINLNAQVSDLMVDVQRTTGATSEQIDVLVEKLKGIDTRTTLSGLLEIAKVGGQMGVPIDQIEGFTRALDKMNVVLKDEIPGGTDVIATALGKIGNIYGTFKQYGIEDGLNKIGSLILEVGQDGLATGEYLQDFAQRVAGSATIMHISLPQVIAYGAALQETGVRSEVAGTAMSRLFLLMGSKPEKFFEVAKLADTQLTLKQFTDYINTDASKALSLFFQGLDKGGDKVTNFFSLLTAAIGRGGNAGQRITEALSKLAQNQDLVNQRLQEGTSAFDAGTKAQEQFLLKNDNLAGSIDHLHRTVQNLVTDPDSNFGKFLQDSIKILDSALQEVNPSLQNFFDNLNYLIHPKEEVEKEGKALQQKQIEEFFSFNKSFADQFSKKSKDEQKKMLDDQVQILNQSMAQFQAALASPTGQSLVDKMTDKLQLDKDLVDRLEKIYNAAPVSTKIGGAADQSDIDAVTGADAKREAASKKADAALNKLIKDQVDKIEANEKRQLNDLEKNYADSSEYDVNYYTRKSKIITEGEDAVLKLLESYHKKDTEEYEKHNSDKIKAEKDANEKIYQLQLAAIIKQHDDSLRGIKSRAAPDENTPPDQVAEFNYKNAVDSAAQEATTLDQLMQLRNKYGKEVDNQIDEEKNRQIVADNAVLASKKKLMDAIRQGAFAQADNDTNQQLVDANLKEQEAEQKINDNKSLTDKERQDQLLKLRRQSEAEENKITTDGAQNDLAINEVLYAAGLESQQQYLDTKLSALKKYNTAAENENKNNTKANQQEDALRAELLQQAVSTVQQAAQAEIDIWSAQVTANHDNAEKLIDIQTERQEKLATSQAQYDQIQQQAQDKKDALDKKERQQQAEIAIVQAGIQFATASFQLWSHMIETSTPATLPLNIGLAAGIEALLATQYAIAIAKLSETSKYEQGGEVPASGGEFGGKSHAAGGTPFSFRGGSFEAEAHEVAIINKNSSRDKKSYTVSGTPKQIASAINVLGGGVPFAKGADLTKLATGGVLGGSTMIGGDYRAPIISINPRINHNTAIDLAEMKSMLGSVIDTVADANKRMDVQLEMIKSESAKKVYIVQKDIDEGQVKRAKLKAVGVI